MGNSQLQQHHNSAKSILISHPIFENAKIVKNTLGKQAIQIGISMKSEKEFLLWEKNFKRIPKIHQLLYPDQVRFQNNGCCGSSGFALVQYQRFPYVLAEEIAIRKNNNMRYFNENELWLLLFSLLSCAEIFHVRKIKVGDIRPQNIFMNEQGSIKVASQYSFPNESVNYEKTLINREIVTYLAPEQVRDLQLGKMKDSSQPSTVQPFSIGLTLLDTALLSSSENFYLPNGTFSAQKLNQALKLLKTLNYSQQIVNIIRRLCEPNQLKRIKINEILEHLKPYENEILLKKNFDFDSLPFGQGKQNPQSASTITDFSPIASRIKNPNQKQGGFKYVNGVVFDHFENSIDFSSLSQSKILQLRNSKEVNNYEVKEQNKVNQLKCPPVQTTIYRPPVVVSLPPPVQHGYNPQQGNQNF